MKTQKIIYSKWLMKELVEKGFMPTGNMPNPNALEYTCWVFPQSNELEQAIQESIAQREGNNNYE